MNRWIVNVIPHGRILMGAMLFALMLAGGAGRTAVLAMENTVTRQEIQHYFTSHEGNSVRTVEWLKRYMNRPIRWSGTVYDIKRHPGSSRLEVLIKVLPDSLLYDTVAVLEGNTMIDSFLQKGSPVVFDGRIFNGVDVLGVKEVQVLVKDPSHIQLDGDKPVHFTPVQ